MQCREFEQRLQLAADLRRDPPTDAEFELHAELCADCSAKREWFVALAKMSNAFRTSPEFAGAGGDSGVGTYDRGRLIRETFSRTSLEGVVVAPASVAPAPVELAKIEPVRRRSRLLLAGSALAVAASIAVFVTLALLPPSQPGGGDSEAALATSVTTPPDEVSAATLAKPSVPVLNPALPFDPGFSISAVDSRRSLEQLRERLTSLPSDPSMTGSLRPITSSFGVAWETLRSALPTGQSNVDPTGDQADASGLGPIAAV